MAKAKTECMKTPNSLGALQTAALRHPPSSPQGCQQIQMAPSCELVPWMLVTNT